MESNNKSSFIDLFEKGHIQKGLSVFSLLSYAISNLLVFFVIAEFFNYSSIWIKGIYLIVGTLCSFLLIKTNLFITPKRRIKKEEKASSRKEEKLKLKVEKGDISSISMIGKWNFIIILIRLLFFNIMNDLFIVLIVWSILFSVGYVTGLITLVPGTFSTLVGLLSIIGILSGIFQFYIQTYKQKIIQQITNTLREHSIGILKKYSFNDFLNYTEKGNKSFCGLIEQKIRKNTIYRLLEGFRDQRRSGKDITNITLNMSGNDILLARSLDYSDIDKGKLKQAYDTYFKSKNQEIKKEIDKLNFQEIRKILFPNIMFFDEGMAQLIRISHNFENIEEPASYEEFLSYYSEQNMLQLSQKLFE